MLVVSTSKRGQTSSETSSFIKKENTTCFSFLFTGDSMEGAKVDFIMSKGERRYAFGNEDVNAYNLFIRFSFSWEGGGGT
jgi:hypothetical protein